MSREEITLANLYHVVCGEKSLLKCNLYSKKQEFYEAVLTKELYEILFAQGLSVATHSKTANGAETSITHFKAAREYMLTTDFVSLQKNMCEVWKYILSNISKHSMNFVKEIFFHDHLLKHDSLLYKRLHIAWNNGKYVGFEELFTSITLMAATRFCWYTNGFADFIMPDINEMPSVLTEEEQAYQEGILAFSEENYDKAILLFEKALTVEDDKLNGQTYYQLSKVYRILSEKTKKQNFSSKIIFYLSKACEKKHPEALLEYAKEWCMETGSLTGYDPVESCELCLEAVNLFPKIDTVIRGEAYYILYQYSQSGVFIPPSGDSALHYLKLGMECGNKKAIREWKNKNSFSLVASFMPDQENSSGICVLNEKNAATNVFCSTVPIGWQVICEEDIIAVTERFLTLSQPQKYLFLSENEEKNLKDALWLLQAVKERTISQKTWQLELYIRGDSEKLSPIMDTALHHMEDNIIPVHIIDDDKWAARRLLSLHPLFYPIRSCMQPDTTLHFVVLGSSNCCQWLIREAFWLMSMISSQKVHTKITVLASDSERFLQQLYFVCKGLHPEFRRSQKELFDYFPEIEGITTSLSSVSLFEVLDQFPENEAYYFALDTGNDLDNLNLAIKIREWTIQRSILCENTALLTELPVIAFRCENPDITHLSHSMVAHLADYGNAWYNNYSILAFGTLAERYCWSEIDGGLLEKMSYCIHMSYNDIPTKEHWKEKESAKDVIDLARKDYYRRQYNRDSSFCVASSIPYRLFDSNYPGVGAVFPPHWNISEGDSFFSQQNRNYFCERLNNVPKKDDRVEKEYEDANGNKTRWTEYGIYSKETRRLALREHIRWCGFLLSRGWLPASEKQMQSYMMLNNHQQQLYIARMHPCICSNDALEHLEQLLKKDLIKYDYSNVMLTEDFLMLRWLEIEESQEDSI